MTEVFIVCPGRAASGGPELCHQLAHVLNGDDAGRAAMVYYPFGAPQKVVQKVVPRSFRDYNAPAVAVEDVTAGATVVLPEVFPELVADFPDCRVAYWWMSVDNFRRKAGPEAAAKLAAIREHAALHLYQSEYARNFLASARLGPAHRLSDRLSDGYLRSIGKPDVEPRRDVVVYNPAKGLGRALQVLRELAKGLRAAPDVVALQDLTPTEVQYVLSVAKVYIDFGGHPGKDRLPREAAALGACVVTNRRGAAGNGVDVPIPDEFKIDDRKPGFERRAAAKIRMILDDFDRQRVRFDPYRKMIAAEPAQFAADVRALFPVKVSA